MTGLPQAASIPEKICGVRVEPEPGRVIFEPFLAVPPPVIDRYWN